MPLSRRRFVQLPLLAGLASATLPASAATDSPVFDLGIASGDPDSNSIVLWTHIRASAPTSVQWQLATDKNFKDIAASGTSQTSAARDFTVKAEVDGLRAGHIYYYRFYALGQYSRIGQTRTLPVGEVDQVSFAVVSCSNFPFGYFNVYSAIGDDAEIDFVVHLGDYIYENDAFGWGGNEGLERDHLPSNELLTLADYRGRHAQYKSDSGSQKMLARHPLIATWDDHETANDPYMDGAKAHQANEGLWPERRRVALQAYYEWMPIRDPKPPQVPENLWRHYNFGTLASLITLETRHTGRSKQIDYAEHLKTISDQNTRDHFLKTVVGASERTMLSAPMQDFVDHALKSSVQAGQAWRILGNQTIMARVNVPDYRAQAQDLSWVTDNYQKLRYTAMNYLGAYNLPYNLDSWHGYPAARERLYEQCQNHKVNDLLVLSGDSHCAWFNALYSDNSQFMGYEIGTTAVTSPGGDAPMGPDSKAAFDELLAAHNPEVLWRNSNYRGYAKLTLRADAATLHYMAVDTVRSPDFNCFAIRTINIQHRGQQLSSDIIV